MKMGGIIILIFALAFLGVGGMFIWVGFSTLDYTDALKNYTPLTDERWQVGEAGYLEGRLSEKNQPAMGELLVYYEFIYGGEQSRTESDITSTSGSRTVKEPIWRETKQETPPLILNVEQTPYQISEGPYSMSNLSTLWSPYDALIKDETLRYEGFVAGDEVVVVGTVTETDSGLAIQPTALWGGDFANYLENNQTGGRFGLFAGIGMVLLSALLFYLGIRISL